jgi:hypothetical protein
VILDLRFKITLVKRSPGEEFETVLVNKKSGWQHWTSTTLKDHQYMTGNPCPGLGHPHKRGGVKPLNEIPIYHNFSHSVGVLLICPYKDKSGLAPCLKVGV